MGEQSFLDLLPKSLHRHGICLFLAFAFFHCLYVPPITCYAYQMTWGASKLFQCLFLPDPLTRTYVYSINDNFKAILQMKYFDLHDKVT